jgi:hypothetical protein
VGTRGSSADLDALDVRVQHRVDQRRVNLLESPAHHQNAGGLGDEHRAG